MSESSKSEVSDSSFEYLLAEILAMQPVHVADDEQVLN